MTLFRKHSAPMRKSTHSPRNFWDMAFDEDFFRAPHSLWDEAKRTFSPAIDVKENEAEYVLEAECPGMEKEDIEISIKDRNICLKGEKRSEREEKKEDYHHVERTFGQFYRTIPLAGDADVEKISADFSNGLLRVNIGKSTDNQKSSRRIDIR